MSEKDMCNPIPIMPPAYDAFYEIYKKDVVYFEYDCSNKTAEYISAVKNLGYDAELLEIDYDGKSKTLYIIDAETGKGYIEIHAIARVFVDGQWLYCDPANNKWSYNICDFAPDCENGILRIIDEKTIANNPRKYGF